MECLSWVEVVGQLGRLRAGSAERVEGCVVDTILFDAEGRVANYLTTSSDGEGAANSMSDLALIVCAGYIVGREENHHTNDMILKHLTDLAVGIQGKRYQHVAFVCRKSRDEVVLMTKEEIQNLLSNYKEDIGRIQSYIPSKGKLPVQRSYRYYLNLNDILIMDLMLFPRVSISFEHMNSYQTKFERVIVSPEIFGSNRVSSSLSMDKAANEVSNKIALIVSYKIANIRKWRG